MRPRRRRRLLLTLLAVAIVAVGAGVLVSHRDRTVTPQLAGPDPNAYRYLRGLNVYTLEFARSSTHPADEQGEPQASYDYLAAQGIRLVRLPIPWQLLQPISAGQSVDEALAQPINQAYLGVVEREVAKIELAGMYPVIDLHNGCSYPAGLAPYPSNEEFCSPTGISTAQASQVWVQLANAFKDDPRIAAYDLFNEPDAKIIRTADYRQWTQAVVTAIRATGDTHRIWVESLLNETLPQTSPTGPWITDPAHDTEYSAHFYPAFNTTDLDAPFSPYRADQFLQRISAFGQWCSEHRARCSIGEIGWPGDDGPQAISASTASYFDNLGGQAYDLADKFGLDVTYFGVSCTRTSYYWAYRCDAGRLDAPNSQAGVLQAHPSKF